MRTVVVTGANKGLGFGIAQCLASRKAPWRIIMACRNVQFGEKAKQRILAKHSEADLHVEQLDISRIGSIQLFCKIIKDKYLGLDILVNNAGVASSKDTPLSIQETNRIFATNFYGTINLTENLLPILNQQAKIITMGSVMGKFMFTQNREYVSQLRNPQLTKQELYVLMNQYRQAIADNSYQQKGFHKSLYGVSKLGINVYGTTVLPAMVQVRSKRIQVYTVCPGYVKTDMTEHNGTLTVEQGIQTPMFLIDLPFEVNPELQGKFIQKCKASRL